MTYRAYIEQATADGYPLRYYKVERKIHSLAVLGTMILLLLTAIKGCDLIHEAAPGFSYVWLIVLTAVVVIALVFWLSHVGGAKPVGFVDFTEDELQFRDMFLNIDSRIAIADIRSIRDTEQSDDGQLKGISTWGTFLVLKLELHNGEVLKMELKNQPFFSDHHEKLRVTAQRLFDYLAAQRTENEPQ